MVVNHYMHKKKAMYHVHTRCGDNSEIYWLENDDNGDEPLRSRGNGWKPVQIVMIS